MKIENVFKFCNKNKIKDIKYNIRIKGYPSISLVSPVYNSER